MPRPRILYYAQDPGGTRYLDPVVSELMRRDRYDWSIILHPFAVGSEFAAEKYKPIRVDFTDVAPAKNDFFEVVLDNIGPDAIICTTSAQGRDSSNGTLIVTARRRGVPVIGALDHWKGLDRFFEDDQPVFFPDHLICIDDSTLKALGKAGLDQGQISKVGHPGLEHIASKNGTPTAGPLKVLLISQPVASDGSYRSIFEEHLNGRRLIDSIAATLTSALENNSISVHFRTHPKERDGDALPGSIKQDTCEGWNDAMARYDVFVGFDSMALIEASLSGAPCIRLALTDMSDVSDQAIPFEFGETTSNLADLAEDIRTAVSKSHVSGSNPFKGSTSCASDVIEGIVNSSL